MAAIGPRNYSSPFRCFAALGHARLDGDDVCDSRDRDCKLRRADAIRSIHRHVRNRNPDGCDLLDACMGISRTTAFDTAHGVLARDGSARPICTFLEVLFGEETVLPSSDRFYQRMLASDIPRGKVTARTVNEATTSRGEVYDTVLVPASSRR